MLKNYHIFGVISTKNMGNVTYTYAHMPTTYIHDLDIHRQYPWYSQKTGGLEILYTTKFTLPPENRTFPIKWACSLISQLDSLIHFVYDSSLHLCSFIIHGFSGLSKDKGNWLLNSWPSKPYQMHVNKTDRKEITLNAFFSAMIIFLYIHYVYIVYIIFINYNI